MGSHASESAAAVLVGLRRIVRLLRIADREAEGSHRVSAAQLFVLHALADDPASSVGELADRTFTDQSSVSGVVAKLIARKLIVRKPSPNDRRRAELRLTTAGERVVRTAPRLPQMMIVDAVQAMPAKHRAELVRGLDRLVAAIGGNAVPPRMLFEDEPQNGKSHVAR
jgi:DNA-binding MarR family transcriptional regulator